MSSGPNTAKSPRCDDRAGRFVQFLNALTSISRPIKSHRGHAHLADPVRRTSARSAIVNTSSRGADTSRETVAVACAVYDVVCTGSHARRFGRQQNFIII